MKKILSLLVPVIFFFALTATAGDTTAIKRSGVIIVMLHGEKNRLNGANKIGDTILAASIGRDAAEIRRRTILDFTENFTAFPVYYVIDSNYDKIRHKQFAGLLLNADGSLANTAVVDTGNPNYLVAYYSFGDYMLPSETELVEKHRFEDAGGREQGRGLVIFNNKLNQLFHYYKWELSNPKSLPAEQANKYAVGKTRRYFFRAAHLDMEYFPMAGKLNRHFLRENDRRSSSLPY